IMFGDESEVTEDSGLFGSDEEEPPAVVVREVWILGDDGTRPGDVIFVREVPAEDNQNFYGTMEEYAHSVMVDHDYCSSNENGRAIHPPADFGFPVIHGLAKYPQYSDSSSFAEKDLRYGGLRYNDMAGSWNKQQHNARYAASARVLSMNSSPLVARPTPILIDANAHASPSRSSRATRLFRRHTAARRSPTPFRRVPIHNSETESEVDIADEEPAVKRVRRD
ncbi:hypothetical protein PFISCL1PPCAC_26680, partial [Pristionchus fissidentatus]